MMKSGTDDLALVRGLIEGHRWSHRKAWLRFAPMVRRMLWRHFGASPDIDDLQQEVFLAFFRKVPGLRDPHAIKPFVGSIVRNTIKHAIRLRTGRKRRDATAHHDALQVEDFVVQPDLGNYRAFKALHAIIEQLSPRDREGFRLRFLCEAEWDEVADVLGISVTTAKRRMGRARRLVATRARSTTAVYGQQGALAP